MPGGSAGPARPQQLHPDHGPAGHRQRPPEHLLPRWSRRTERPASSPYSAGTVKVTQGDKDVIKKREQQLRALPQRHRRGRQRRTRPDPAAADRHRPEHADHLQAPLCSIALPLKNTQATLNDLALLLLLVSGIGVVGAGAAGLAVARAGLRPVDKLTEAVEHVARTEDLSVRIPVEEDSDDEIARLSHSFNSMTSSLANSRELQQQLIADAGHELRTPLTSLRTNIELLTRSEETGRPDPRGGPQGAARLGEGPDDRTGRPDRRLAGTVPLGGAARRTRPGGRPWRTPWSRPCAGPGCAAPS